MLTNGVEIGASDGVYVAKTANRGTQRHMSSVNSYVCTTYGYMQHYLADAVVLAEIAQSAKWTQIKPSS
jgi:hypothetical protein